eukprot:scaffold61196_cov63-Phaeocystis_antarctica.AAC.2
MARARARVRARVGVGVTLWKVIASRDARARLAATGRTASLRTLWVKSDYSLEGVGHRGVMQRASRVLLTNLPVGGSSRLLAAASSCISSCHPPRT